MSNETTKEYLAYFHTDDLGPLHAGTYYGTNCREIIDQVHEDYPHIPRRDICSGRGRTWQ